MNLDDFDETPVVEKDCLKLFWITKYKKHLSLNWNNYNHPSNPPDQLIFLATFVFVRSLTLNA